MTRLLLYKHQSFCDSFKVILKLKTKLNSHSCSIPGGLIAPCVSLTSPPHPCGWFHMIAASAQDTCGLWGVALHSEPKQAMP